MPPVTIIGPPGTGKTSAGSLGQYCEPITKILMGWMGSRWITLKSLSVEKHPTGEWANWRAWNGCGTFPWGDETVEVRQQHGEQVMETHADLRLPWSVEPLEGKYYGTMIRDADGLQVAEFWDHSVPSVPSTREKEHFGDDWSEAAWSEYCCDSHWESERDYVRAKAIVEAMNSSQS